MNIAILSPNKNSYSETFIQAQRIRLKGKVFYYYDGFVPRYLDGEGYIQIKFGYIRKRLGLLFQDILSESLLQSLKNHHKVFCLFLPNLQLIHTHRHVRNGCWFAKTVVVGQISTYRNKILDFQSL